MWYWRRIHDILEKKPCRAGILRRGPLYMTETLSRLFFSQEINWLVALFRIALSFFAGFVLGLERKMQRQPAGLRTHILISVASTLLMLLSIYMAQTFTEYGGEDPARIAAQVVSGIGFLGGGAILRQGLNIRGLTTAATLWASAAIGLALGAGMIAAPMIVLAVIMVTLVFLEKLESRYFPAERTKILYFVFRNEKIDFDALQDVAERYGLIIINMDVSKTIETQRINVSFSVKVPPHIDIQGLVASAKEIGKLEKFKLSD